MPRIGIRLAALMAALLVLLLPALAWAQSADTPPAELVSMVFAHWGQWSVVVGLGILVAVQVWRVRIAPEVWEAMNPWVRRALPPVVSALTTAAVGLATGATWAEAGQVFAVQWVTLEWAAGVMGGLKARGESSAPSDAIRGAVDEYSNAGHTEEAAHAALATIAGALAKPANAKPAGKPPLNAALVLGGLLLVLGLGGCAPHLATVAPPQPPELGSSELGVRTPEEQADRCERTSDTAWWLRTISGGMVVAAGAEGAGAIPIDDRETVRALAIGAGATAGAAAVVAFVGQAYEARYADECAGAEK